MRTHSIAKQKRSNASVIIIFNLKCDCQKGVDSLSVEAKSHIKPLQVSKTSFVMTARACVPCQESFQFIFIDSTMGIHGGAVVSAFTSQRKGPGLNPGWDLFV